MIRELVTEKDINTILEKCRVIKSMQNDLDETKSNLLTSYSWKQWTELSILHNGNGFLQQAIKRYRHDTNCDYETAQNVVFNYMDNAEGVAEGS